MNASVKLWSVRYFDDEQDGPIERVIEATSASSAKLIARSRHRDSLGRRDSNIRIAGCGEFAA